LEHKGSGKKAHYGAMASIATTIEVPENPKLKDITDFKIIGNSKKKIWRPKKL